MLLLRETTTTTTALKTYYSLLSNCTPHRIIQQLQGGHVPAKSPQFENMLRNSHASRHDTIRRESLRLQTRPRQTRGR